jgi:hypothetical protein
MSRRGAMLLVLLVAASAVPVAHATQITTYGSGLKPCGAYVAAREWDSADVVAFTDWLGGYLSGVNSTSKHRNNLLGQVEFKGAMYWLDDFCRTHPDVHFADAAGLMLIGAKSGPAAHSVEVTSYGSGYKSCEKYLESREQQSIKAYLQAHAWENVDAAQFVDWLGGYVSGVNAISSATDNVLGSTELKEAVYWLDSYCGAHQPATFSDAVEALIAAHLRDRRQDVAQAQPPLDHQ